MDLPPAEPRLAIVETRVDDVVKDVGEIKGSIARIEERLIALIAGRPSWGVTVIVSLLSATTVGLAVAVASKF